jgi:hypothetical protein
MRRSLWSRVGFACAIGVVLACESARPPVLPERPSGGSLPGENEGAAPILETLAPSEPGSLLDVEPPPRPRPPGAYANIDPDDDLVVAPPDPRPDCAQELAQAGVTFRLARLPVHKEKGGLVCGAPQVVTYLRGPGKITYDPIPTLTCGMALALASFERILQEEAESTMHSRVVRVTQLGTYNCREMAAYTGWVSEHSYANAIDLDRFVFKSGKVAGVLRDFDTGDETPAKPAGLFLHRVSQRAFDEEIFSHVLTPFFDAHHKNHFHLDLARYRSEGTRPQS